MVIVISNPTKLQNEASRINDLFDRGMPLLHLRKPEYSEMEMAEILSEIDEKYLSKIALHQHHNLADEFGINRLHFTEEVRLTEGKGRRRRTEPVEVKKEELVEKGYILSTSIHSLEDYYTLSPVFSYTFFGPVYDSISKPDYKAIDYNLSSLPQNRATKLIALGGIDKNNFEQLLYQGFDGIGLLGSVWEFENENTLEYIIEKCHTIVQ